MTAPLPPFPSGVRLRPVRPSDEPFLLRLYGTLRAPDLAALPWDAAQKRAFIAEQFHLQQTHYRQTRPHADYWLVEKGPAAPIGRLSLDRSDTAWRILELLLLPRARGNGLGTALIHWVQAAARAAAADAVTLHVETGNHQALRLYARLGFVDAPSAHATHRFLRWTPGEEAQGRTG
ncbi:GNAT family N-acetyltransferase [Sphingomonas elodea]|uniref:GNAT family N-acetyltransferase n=1 Tax=Sphingomonas elodea TaxID=179878 RepID=UPI0002630594|nr:GNAT family N-acetyltransferase [Sphingomonas elodea]